jgi:TM2 domain-containing membrane protein YozV
MVATEYIILQVVAVVYFILLTVATLWYGLWSPLAKKRASRRKHRFDVSETLFVSYVSLLLCSVVHRMEYCLCVTMNTSLTHPCGLSLCLSVSLSVCLSVCLSLCLSVCQPSLSVLSILPYSGLVSCLLSLARCVDPAGVYFYGYEWTSLLSYETSSTMLIGVFRAFYLTLCAGYGVMRTNAPKGVMIMSWTAVASAFVAATFCGIARFYTDSAFWGYGLFLFCLVIPEILVLLMLAVANYKLQQAYNNSTNVGHASSPQVTKTLSRIRKLMYFVSTVVILVCIPAQVWLGVDTIGEIEDEVDTETFEFDRVLFFIVQTVILTVLVWFIRPSETPGHERGGSHAIVLASSHTSKRSSAESLNEFTVNQTDATVNSSKRSSVASVNEYTEVTPSTEQVTADDQV